MTREDIVPRSIPVITIDGPSGSGKGTIARLLARRLGYAWLDSGALYRLLALSALEQGTAVDDVAGLASLGRGLDVTFIEAATGEPVIRLEGRDVGAAMRSEACGGMASRIAALPEVREALLQRQRDFRAPPGLVADGRDMGTVVFPDASLKIYLDASAEERARRRYKQLKEKGINASLSALSDELARRDERDMNRSVAPLRPADDAIVVDSTGLSIDEVLEKVSDLAT